MTSELLLESGEEAGRGRVAAKKVNKNWFNSGAVEWETATGQRQFLFFLLHLSPAGRALDAVGLKNNFSFSSMVVKAQE